MANLYFVDEAMTAATQTVELVGVEARHAVQVARVRVGDHFEVSDGNGWRADATVTDADKSRVVCSVDRCRLDAEPRLRIVLAQALAKGDRDELAVQAATELGVSVVVPWQSERSVSKWVGDKAAKGVTRWTAIVREASKQSMRSRIPIVNKPVSTSGICASAPDATWIVLDPRGEQSLSSWYAAADRPTAIGIVVGPEGGIADNEIDSLRALGATPVRLDGPILRTSTAGPAAIAALLALGGVW
jgi:16S rRNA (uracil1498-N3)-methyltransferase